MRIELYFSRPDYEYDIYGLVGSFFPGATLVIRDGSFGPFFVTRDGSGDPIYGNHKSDEGSLGFFYKESSAVFSWDLPIALTAGRLRGEAETAITDWADRWKTKNELKTLVYHKLVDLTGKTLPWGALSGIRPVKLARKEIDAGLSEAEAARVMREAYFTSEEKASLAAEIAARELRLTEGLDLKDGFSLYVGIPFCPTICAYCTFGSHPIDRWANEVDSYIDRLSEELFAMADCAGRRPPTSIYVGGGTPTAISAAQLDRVLKAVRTAFPTETETEFTVEAGRPDTLDPEKLDVLKENSVTRISINPQTMNADTLKRIGRAHSPEETEAAFALAREKGFSNINMDLIAGLPGEGEEEVRRTLRRVQALGPDSLTIHSLARKRASRINREREDYEADSFQNTEAIMSLAADAARALDMRPYYLYRQKNMAGNLENVGYAKDGRECLYNILIMEELQTILGVGSAATTKFVYDRGAATGRAESVKGLRDYLDRFDELLARKQAAWRQYEEEKKKYV